jgi:GNAT superfamily N-acetyltransferase
MDFVIRPYAPADDDWVLDCAVGLQEHERALHDTRLPGLPHSRAYLAMLRDVLADNHGIMLIAENAGGERLGLVAGHVVDEPWPMETRDSTRYGYVSDIFIKPEARGTGLAEALLDAIGAASAPSGSRPEQAPGERARSQRDCPTGLREGRLHAP